MTPFPVDFQVYADRRAWWGDVLPSAGALHDRERSLRELIGRVVYGARCRPCRATGPGGG